MRPLRVLIVGVTALALFALSAPVLADHGNIPWGNSDDEPFGRWRFELAECTDPTSFSAAQIAIEPPWSVSTSKVTAVNEAQLVLWTPRIWWAVPGTPKFDHEDVTLWTSVHDWHYAWVREGDYKDAWMVPYKNEMFTGGGTYPSWTNLRTKVTDGAYYRAVADLNLNVSRVFLVEDIIYWGGTSLDPGDEYRSEIRMFSGDLLQAEPACIPGQ